MPMTVSEKKPEKVFALIQNFRAYIIATIIIPLSNGKTISLPKFFIPQFATLKASKPNPIPEIKVLNSITADVPDIPYLVVRG